MMLSATLLKVHSKPIGLAVFQASEKYLSLIMALIMLQIATTCMRGRIFRTSFEVPLMPGALYLFIDLRTLATSLGEVGMKSRFAGSKARGLL